MMRPEWNKLLGCVACCAVLMGSRASGAMVAAWSFNDAPGGAIENHVGPAGTLRSADAPYDTRTGTGGPAFVPSGAGTGEVGFGWALRLDGMDDEVALGRSPALALGRDDLTITGWFRCADSASQRPGRIIDNAEAGVGGVVVSVTPVGRDAGRLFVEVAGPIGQSVSVMSDARVDDGQWHGFAVVVRDGVLSLYVDGRPQRDTVAYADGTTASPSPTKRATLGRYFAGELDELAVFNHALSDEELVRVYHVGMADFGYAPDVVAKPAIENSDITVTEHVVFDGDRGWQHNGVTYRLACAVVMTEAPNGDLLAAWLSGSNKEPATDNCVLMARSDDGGVSWSQPWILVPAGDEAGAVTNLYTADDGRVIVLGAHWPAEAEYTVWHYFRMESRDSGQTWSEPVAMSIADDRASLGHRVALQDGSYFFPGSFFQPREQALRASVRDLALAPDEAMAARLSATTDESQMPGKFGRFLHGCLGFAAQSEDASDLTPLGQVADRPLGLLEPTAIQLNDGTIVMLMRAEWGGYLWRAESSDGGRTWTRAQQTDIPNPSALTCLVRLPDGRIALLHNPSGGQVGQRDQRDPLAIWISDDEMKTWGVRKTLATGGKLAYPHAIITRAGELLVSYDFNRRQIRCLTVKLGSENTE